jgi:hypothetical protein
MASVDVLCGFWDHDGGALLLQSAYIAEGLRPYIDFATHHPPLTQIIGSVGVLLGIDRLVLTIVLPMLWMIATSAATIALARAAGGDPVMSILAGAIYPLFSVQNGGNHVANELPVAFFSCLAFIPIVKRGTITPGRLAIAAALASAATLSKQNGVIAFVPIIVACAVDRNSRTLRHVAAFVVGSAAMPMLVAAWLGFDFPILYEHLVRRLAVYGSHSHFLGPTLEGEYRRAPETILLFALGVCTGLIVAARKGDPRFRLLALTGTLGIIVQLVPRLFRNYPHYNLSAWPFLALVLAVALAQPWSGMKFALRLALAAIALSAGVTSAFVPTWDQPGLLLSTYAPAAETLQGMTSRDTRIRQYGAEPIIEFLAHRREELLSWPITAHINWDGHGRYSGAPPGGVTVVVVDAGRPWVSAVLADLRRWNYKEVATFGRHPRVSIYVEEGRR